MKNIQLPLSEYQRLQEELALLKNELLRTINKFIDFLYQDKYGLYMGEYTEDLTEYAVDQAWESKPSGWDSI